MKEFVLGWTFIFKVKTVDFTFTLAVFCAITRAQ